MQDTDEIIDVGSGYRAELYDDQSVAIVRPDGRIHLATDSEAAMACEINRLRDALMDIYEHPDGARATAAEALRGK